MIEIISQISEIAISEVATAAIENISKKTKISPFHLAMNVEGLVHDHPPCEYNVETCSYCKRNGNIFANDDSYNTIQNDVISKYKQKVNAILEEMFREITNIVNEKSFDDDDDDDDEPINESDDDNDVLDLDDMLEKAFGKPDI
ncbi:hypothetical protein PBCVNY2B_225L [Paramecium bursaria Chlorella virus NY2B]|uniref:Uncharacterized protein n=1 Tax=Paramecium bursaria Chlorella virus NYs1 TaxID=83442 RepID=M1IJI3_9PHYC|nr:hypothetical protein FK949_gp070 [Paramecium bursaria Chlorella virus NYs1]AGE54143.1 hypothetical protein PBCVIL52s1_219L [Paramecium bursaria Chlorella virus IL-5-2s1]AGE58264.1 hypothetical protein PBCVNY2B_225L [Paramecium bursaria Chlorella virus NY2B]AGE58635.1 hypothetical protein PBCVNYs1_203L [Paramecium bursaria Chlorella virus NYs1]